MGKTHEALERAQKEYAGGLPDREPTLLKEAVQPPPPRRASNQAAMEWYQDLKTNLLSRYPDKSIKTILFAGTTHGDGSSTTAINFATTLAENCTKKVLLVDMNLRTPSLHEAYKIDHTFGLSDFLANNNGKKAEMKRVGPGNLYVLPCGGKNSGPVSLFESARFDRFLENMRKQFDYVILDAPPMPRFSESRVVCPKVDGVIIVLGSGKTRREVAIRAKKALEEAGGKVLGVVLNRRKFYIPNWIYKRL
jgi:protein-tyrosine kinase